MSIPPPESTSSVGTTALVLDWVERIAVTALYGFLVARVITGVADGAPTASLLILASEGIVIAFILVRRTTEQVSRRPLDWLLALGATSAPMLVDTGVRDPLVPVLIAAIVLIFGSLIQIHAKITLGRSMGAVPANRGLKVHGPYQLVRHPMYAGYLIGHVAFLAINPTVRNVIVYLILYVLQIPRLLIEERLLADDPEYVTYMSEVRWRLIPGLF